MVCSACEYFSLTSFSLNRSTEIGIDIDTDRIIVQVASDQLSCTSLVVPCISRYISRIYLQHHGRYDLGVYQQRTLSVYTAVEQRSGRGFVSLSTTSWMHDINLCWPVAKIKIPYVALSRRMSITMNRVYWSLMLLPVIIINTAT